MEDLSQNRWVRCALSIEHVPFFISIAAAGCIPAVPDEFINDPEDGKRSMRPILQTQQELTCLQRVSRFKEL